MSVNLAKQDSYTYAVIKVFSPFNFLWPYMKRYIYYIQSIEIKYIGAIKRMIADLRNISNKKYRSRTWSLKYWKTSRSLKTTSFVYNICEWLVLLFYSQLQFSSDWFIVDLHACIAEDWRLQIVLSKAIMQFHAVNIYARLYKYV